MHAILGLVAFVGLIAFAFGERTARVCAGTVIIAGTLAFFYIAYRIVTGTI